MTRPGHAEAIVMTARSLAPNPASEAEMLEWKRLAAQAAAAGRPLQLRYFGSANQIAGYRLHYMLQYAKQAGVEKVALYSDGQFWIDEATDWLAECGVDEVVLEVPAVPAPLQARIASLAARSGPHPAVTVRPASS